MSLHQISNDAVSLVVDANIGRVTSLIDLRRKREWLIRGVPRPPENQEADFSGMHTYGWDECFPTVGSCAVSEWGDTLRDHGDLWGRSWSIDCSNAHLSMEYAAELYTFRRKIRLDGPRLHLDYELANKHPRPLPWLWSQHCLLNCKAGEVFQWEGLGSEFRDEEGNPTNPDRVHPWGSKRLSKSYASIPGAAVARIRGECGSGSISFHFPPDGPVRHVGLWECYGSWPADAPRHEVAIEPTNLPFGRLDHALRTGNATWLEAESRRQWSLLIELTE
ncbi:hypothetical protein [Nitratireductor sp. CH_MIT9313-5]|uniref:hypothetical protein n=1 Tax=Nitratireductor sp. CH_MIT9313-5 TaxID=3107764 RepID=UPI00300A36BC